MTDAIPKLTKREMDRLREIGLGHFCHPAIGPVTTLRLIKLGFVGHVSLVDHNLFITPAGRAVLEAAR